MYPVTENDFMEVVLSLLVEGQSVEIDDLVFAVKNEGFQMSSAIIREGLSGMIGQGLVTCNWNSTKTALRCRSLNSL